MVGAKEAVSNSDRVKELLEKSPGIDKFGIASNLKLDVVETQRILSSLQKNHLVVSGFKKPKGSSTYDRRYFLL